MYPPGTTSPQNPHADTHFSAPGSLVIDVISIGDTKCTCKKLRIGGSKVCLNQVKSKLFFSCEDMMNYMT